MRPHEIAVIGAGPRGTAVLERLVANVHEIASREQVIVHVIEPETPGAGRVWQLDQSPELLMNTISADITVFTDDTVRCAGPITPGPTQYEWARAVAEGEIDDGLDDGMLAEARAMRPSSYSTRAFQGHYLSWAFRAIVARAPDRLRVVVHRDRAVAAEEAVGGRQRIRLERSAAIEVDALVLASGHVPLERCDRERGTQEFATRHGARYLPPTSPCEADLDDIAPGEPVLLRGLGLSFYDYVALLTTGRGGAFERDGDRLRYRASGREPVLWAGSGRGTPYTSRAESEDEELPRHRPRFFDAEVVARLRARTGTGRTEFLRDLWPWIAKEAGWVYYRCLLAEDPSACEEFSSAYVDLTWGSQAMTDLIARHVPDPAARWDWDAVDRPCAGRWFADHEDYGRWVRARLDDDLAESRRGPVRSARKATAAMMRDLRDQIRQVVSHRGIAGGSYRDEVERWFSGLVNYFASGPPARRVEELVALQEAGLVRFVGPLMRVTTDDEQGVFVGESSAVGGEPVRTRVLVDAFLYGTDVRRAADPLLRHLLATGQIRAHWIPGPGAEGYETGGLDITEGDHRIVDGGGYPHPSRFAYGPPVESVQWVTAVGARPHGNSGMLRQADTIARQALTAAPAVRSAPAGPAGRTRPQAVGVGR